MSFSGTSGGAARAAGRLHSALRHTGVDSVFISGDPVGSDHELRAVGPLGQSGRWFHQKFERLLVEAQRHQDVHMRSLGIFDGPSLGAINELGPDVVNLHLTSFGFMSVRQMSKISQPVVWTLHDMWGFSGAEHYSDDDGSARWKTEYKRANRVPGDRGLDLDRWTWRRKVKHWTNPVNLVAPSQWLADCCRQATLTKGWPVRVIPYSIEIERFPLIDQQIARRSLGIPQDSPVIVFGAAGAFDDPRKGWDLLRQALPKVRGEFPELRVLVFGGETPSDADLQGGVRWVGTISRDDELAKIYAAGDVLALPSRFDNLPLVGMEAQLCGLRLVGFETCGIPDLVPSALEGSLARPFDVGDLGSKLIDHLRARNSNSQTRSHVRASALQRWSAKEVASQYQQLYSEVLRERGETN